MTTALAPSNNYLLAMPFIENAYDYNCTPYGQVGLADTSYHHIKTELFDDNNHALLSHKQQLLNDESTCSLSLPSVSSSGQSSPQQTVPTLLMSSALCGYASDENNHPIKTEDFQYDQLDFDSVSSSEPSPVTGSFNDLDIMLNPPPVPQQSTYYHHQHHHHHHHHQAPQKMCNEDDAASDNSYPSPVLIENDMPFNLQENIYQNYCDVLSRSHHSANNTGLEQGAQIDQMRFILYEPANDGTALVPTINSNNSPIAPPALWSTSLTSVSTSTTAQSTLSFPFDYISSQNALPGTSLTPPTTALQSTHARTHSTTQGQTTQQTPIKCPQPDCPKTFSRLYNLKAHLRSHSPARPYQCPMCPRSFSRKHDLQRHIRVHTGVKPYQCPACHKAFARTDALRRHLKVEPACRESEACQNMKSNRKRYNQEMH